jgi:thymidine phosphorylase
LRPIKSIPPQKADDRGWARPIGRPSSGRAGSVSRLSGRAPLRVRRVALDTGRENVVVISRRSQALRPEVFRAFARVELRAGARVLLATLVVSDDDGLVAPDEIGLGEPAFRRFGAAVGDSVEIVPAEPPDSLDAVRAKIRGETLDASALRAIVGDLVDHRYSDMEIAAFLIGSASFLSSEELLALTRAMADAGTRLTWANGDVVDKHCIGGIPGNRTSMIVVPIVAAHGLTIPKTSSRAITSPAGTADTMETLARVDLDIDEMRAVVAECRGCLVWGGHVALSPADDILIAVERPLGLDTREQMVASILSKKLAAGSTRLLVDVPVGPSAKVTDATEAMRLRKLFEFVGDRIGIRIEVVTTDGRQPIGTGVGPILEAADVMAVLAGEPAAPADLRDKSLRLAGRLLDYDPALRGGRGLDRARELLESGAALRQMQRIVAAQGPTGCRTTLGRLTRDVLAPADGVVAAIDCLRINRIARKAGAPVDAGAGLRIFKKIGDPVEAGEPLYRIFANDVSGLELAAAAAQTAAGYAFAAGPAPSAG